jgi:tyrosine-protein kinase Etk/Wzc
MPFSITDKQEAPDNNLPSQDDDEVDLGEVVDTLIGGKWIIVLVVLVTSFLGVTKAYLEKPVFSSEVLLQVNERAKPLAGLASNSLEWQHPTEMPVMAEIELIRSRMILGEVIHNLNLDIIARPKYFPIVGEAIARRFQLHNKDKEISSPLFWRTQNAWGGEAIRVETFIVPKYLQDKELTLLAGREGHFQLIDNEEVIVEGKVGEFIKKKLNNNQESIDIFVSLLRSRPGTQFIIKQQSVNVTLKQLRKNLVISEKGLNTGLIELILESYDSKYAVRILNEIANIYVQKNVEQKSVESQKTLDFLDEQLPILKKKWEDATNILNDYRNNKGSIDLAIETQHILNGIVEIKTQITLLQQKRDGLRERFKAPHPTVISVDKQIGRLQRQLRSYDKEINTLPETQQAILGLSRDLKVSEELYTTLLNNAQTLRVTKAGTVGDIRIIDYAVLSNKPIRPDKLLHIGAALILGLILGVMVVFIRKTLHRGMEDPDLIEKLLYVPVYATVAHSKIQESLSKELTKPHKSDKKWPPVLSVRYKEDSAIESLRSLRTTLHFSLLEAQNNIIMITGPSPGVGKTFVAINLAAVMADSGKKVLLIDGDMRKGTLNKSLCVNRENGLSDVISNRTMFQEAIRKIPQVNIDFIPTGSIPPNPSELLLHDRFSALLEVLTTKYDLVIIDSPPILAVTDAAIIGKLVGATFMVVKAGLHPKRELKQSISKLTQSGAELKGIVFNNLSRTSSRYVHQYSYKQSD